MQPNAGSATLEAMIAWYARGVRGPWTHPAPHSGGQLELHADGDAAEPDVERWLLCLACDARVARPADAIVVNGQHAHMCVNPDGISYDIACYRHAAGCRELGAPETFWSWFAGYAWRPATCRSCALHLGWGFGRELDHFFGLIRRGCGRAEAAFRSPPARAERACRQNQR